MSKILILTGDVVGQKMAGPAIRAFEFAKILSKSNHVTLATPKNSLDAEQFDFEIDVFTNEPKKSYVESFDVAIVPASLILNCDVNTVLVIDLYDPFILSNLSKYKDNQERELFLSHEFNFLIEKLIYGDFFICASEKQRDFWFGMLTALQRVNIYNSDFDESFEGVISVVPFGIPENYQVVESQSPFPTNKEDDFWMIWGGGIWNWFDPCTLIESFNRLKNDLPGLKLFFMGTRHPNPKMAKMARAREAVNLSKKMNLIDKRIFFGDWIDYNKRFEYLSKASVGISLHFDTIETRFSYRTRILDYIWARLPIICTKGDAMAEIVQTNMLGITVDYEDIEGLTAAIQKMSKDGEFRKQCETNIQKIASNFQWTQIVYPLEIFCKNPRKASDHGFISETQEKILNKIKSCCTERMIEPIGEITKHHIVRQSFRCDEHNLCRIDLKFGNYARKISGDAEFILKDSKDDEIKYKTTINLAKVEDNAWKSFCFDPLRSRNRNYEIQISAPKSNHGNSITIWADPEHTRGYSIGDETREGSLTMRCFRSADHKGKDGDLTFWSRLMKWMLCK